MEQRFDLNRSYHYAQNDSQDIKIRHRLVKIKTKIGFQLIINKLAMSFFSFPMQTMNIDSMMNLDQKDSHMFPNSTFGSEDSNSVPHQKQCQKTISIIKYVDLTKHLKKGTNIAKFIVICFASKIREYRKLYGTDQKLFQETNALLQNLLLKAKNCLNLTHLKELFGENDDSRKQIRNFLNCKVLDVIFEQNLLDFVMSNPKIEDKITYLNCVLKYVGRLRNRLLSERIQSR